MMPRDQRAQRPSVRKYQSCGSIFKRDTSLRPADYIVCIANKAKISQARAPGKSGPVSDFRVRTDQATGKGNTFPRKLLSNKSPAVSKFTRGPENEKRSREVEKKKGLPCKDSRPSDSKSLQSRFEKPSILSEKNNENKIQLKNKGAEECKRFKGYNNIDQRGSGKNGSIIGRKLMARRLLPQSFNSSLDKVVPKVGTKVVPTVTPLKIVSGTWYEVHTELCSTEGKTTVEESFHSKIGKTFTGTKKHISIQTCSTQYNFGEIIPLPQNYMLLTRKDVSCLEKTNLPKIKSDNDPKLLPVLDNNVMKEELKSNKKKYVESSKKESWLAEQELINSKVIELYQACLLSNKYQNALIREGTTKLKEVHLKVGKLEGTLGKFIKVKTKLDNPEGAGSGIDGLRKKLDTGSNPLNEDSKKRYGCRTLTILVTPREGDKARVNRIRKKCFQNPKISPVVTDILQSLKPLLHPSSSKPHSRASQRNLSVPPIPFSVLSSSHVLKIVFSVFILFILLVILL